MKHTCLAWRASSGIRTTADCRRSHHVNKEDSKQQRLSRNEFHSNNMTTLIKIPILMPYPISCFVQTSYPEAGTLPTKWKGRHQLLPYNSNCKQHHTMFRKVNSLKLTPENKIPTISKKSGMRGSFSRACKTPSKCINFLVINTLYLILWSSFLLYFCSHLKMENKCHVQTLTCMSAL